MNTNTKPILVSCNALLYATRLAGHFLHGKWAVLMDPKNPDMGPRGFIRCHIYLIRKGEQLKVCSVQIRD